MDIIFVFIITYYTWQDFICRLLRKRSEKRMSSGECLEHTWLEEKEIENKTARISIENLRKFLARRKLKNVGRVLRAINVFKETARDSRFPFVFLVCPPYPVFVCSGPGLGSKTALRRRQRNSKNI